MTGGEEWGTGDRGQGTGDRGQGDRVRRKRKGRDDGEMGDGKSKPTWRRRARQLLVLVVAIAVGYYVLAVVGLVYLRFLPPVVTMVQAQRAVERVVEGERPIRDYRWRSVEDISSHLPRAVVAAEDARFYRHSGFDWEELQKAREQAERTGRPMRGASTLTQQLMKNLYFTTHRNPVRKLYEWGLTPPAEWILGKDRIVELYVNVVELGPGIFGAEAGARHHYGVSGSALTRYQSASLAAILPAPRSRKPENMAEYTGIILGRMSQMGW